MPISNPPTPSSVRAIVTGSYTGNNGDGRQIAIGMKCSLVIIINSTANTFVLVVPSHSHWAKGTTTAWVACTARQYLHATDGFVVGNTTDFMNTNGVNYYYWAISE